MNLDDDDLTPSGAGSLRGQAAPPAREPVATFTTPPALSLDEIWHGRPATRFTDVIRGGSQGNSFGNYRPGHGLEHQPVNKAGRDAQRTAQDAADFIASVAHIRAALRPGGLA